VNKDRFTQDVSFAYMNYGFRVPPYQVWSVIPNVSEESIL